MSIVLRYFFDPGSGVCLWSGNAEAEARWGYAVDHAALPLRDGTRRFLQELVVRFDTSIDWSDPGAAGGRRPLVGGRSGALPGGGRGWPVTAAAGACRPGLCVHGRDRRMSTPTAPEGMPCDR